VSATSPTRRQGGPPAGRSHGREIEGLTLLALIVGVMWLLEIINTLDHNALDGDGGIYPRSLAHVWAILTAPFLHVSFAHLIDNTIPFVFMGVIIALRGAAKLALVTAVVIVVGGLGTWLIAPSHSVTVGASGVVFGYAAYLLTRGLFDHSWVELLIGVGVAVIWGGALLSSLVPHYGVSWQGHLCGAIGGVVAAGLLAGDRSQRPGKATPEGSPVARALAK
jgi:membrane associated rhomboid family serine protease